jgi:GntR family transcriptional regulator/MocR family aminotransferase
MFAVEDPADPLVPRALAACGATVRAIRVDREGLSADALPADARLVAVTPGWQYPSGGTMPAHRRASLLAWAEAREAIVVEDDRDGDLRYGGSSPPALQSSDDDGRVVHIGSFSRLIAPGLGLAYAVLPDRLVAPVRDRLAAEGLDAPRLEQRALASLLADGQLDRQVRRLRKALAERQAALVEALDQELPDLLAAAPAPAGRHLVARIRGTGVAAGHLSFRAREAGVAVTPLSRYESRPSGDERLLIGYAGHAPPAIAEGIRELRRAVRSVSSSTDRVRAASSGRRPAASP